MLLAPNSHAGAVADVCRAVTVALTNELTARYDRLGLGLARRPLDLPEADPSDPTWVARLIDLAGQVSSASPAAIVGRVADALNFVGKPVNGSRVILVGLGGIDGAAPGVAVLERLIQKGARAEYHDPAVLTLPPFRQYPRVALVSQALSAEALAGCDAVVVLGDPPPSDAALIRKYAPRIVDVRDAATT